MTTLSTQLDRTAPVDPPDPASIMLMAVALVGLGVTMIYSASADLGGTPAGWQFWNDPGLRQLIFVPPALICMWLASHIPHTFWRMRRIWWLSPVVFALLITLGLLASVYVLPASITESHGARRWIKIGGGFSIQPSEIGKVALVLILAAVLADPRFDPRRFMFISKTAGQGWPDKRRSQLHRSIGWLFSIRLHGLILLLVLTCAIVLPVIKEDFGTGALIAAVAVCVMFAGGIRFWQLMLFIPPTVLAGYLYVRSSQFRWNRMQAWLGLVDDPNNPAVYHIQQSMMAIASGGSNAWAGRGLGQGIQKFYYLPEGTTDFIFANLCEELGLIGAFIVIGVFLMLLWQLRRAMLASTDRLGQLIVLGVMLIIGLQAAMNIAVVTGAAPPKGIALPFVSAGGSGLIIMSIALGLAASVARGARRMKPQINTDERG